jgi:nitrogen-specific signal transduction histidine kinase
MQEYKQLHVSSKKVDTEQINSSESFNLASNACVATDLQFRIRKVNIAGLYLFGQTFDFLDRMPLLQFVSMSNRHAVCALTKTLMKSAEDRSKSIEITMCPPRRDAVTCSTIVTLIRDCAGEPRGFLWVLRGEQSLHSQEANALNHRAHQAVHEFSNLLAGIRIHADVAAVTRSSRDRQESLDAIRNNCERAAGLLSKLRAFKNDAIQ